MEGMAILGPNVVSFLLKSGAIICYVVGAYVPPNDVSAMYRVEQALRAGTKGIRDDPDWGT